MLEILFEDQELVVINKPAGLLVHKTALAYGEEMNALIALRDQIGSWVAPVHRLDRATSGCLLFAKNEQILPKLQGMFMERKIQKTYLCLVRGIPSEKQGLIDQPLTSERSGKLQNAQSKYRVLAETEQPFNSTGRYPTSRYSLLELELLTGRTHQIRRHLAHIRHYILGDKKHGDNKQNSYFEKYFGLQHLLLHAWQLRFTHPISGKILPMFCDPPPHFQHIVEKLGWNCSQLTSAPSSSPVFDLL
ncbi:MAG: pseudouridine synthase [Bacteroidetes bacterium]|nr:pseudouridine synthase [Bacteroidota bacterium]MDA1268735.1 pseudouridine synthase [Bacteroidota bacterium]